MPTAFEDSEALFDLEQRWESAGSAGDSDSRLATPAKSGHRFLRVFAALMTASVLIVWFTYRSRNPDAAKHSLVGSDSAIVPQEYEPFSFGTRPLEFAMVSAIDEVDPIDRQGLLVPVMTDLAPIAPLRWVVERAGPPRELSEKNVFQRPTSEEVFRARSTFQIRFPDLEKLALPNQVSTQLQLLQTASLQLEPGSVDDWTCQLLMAERAWMVSDSISVRQQLNQTAARYGVSVERLLAETFEAACGLARLPETQRHLLDQGVPVADQLLISESFSASRQVVAALTPLAQSLEQERASLQLRQFSDAIDQAERLSSVAARVQIDGFYPLMNEDQSAVLGSETGVLGRYFCLYLRRWDTGLPWLAKAADSRLASAARRQLALGASATTAETAEVASLWLALADRAKGRIADSMRLHGLGMLERLLEHSSGVEKLRLRRRIEEQASQLPAYLQRRLVTG